MLNPTDFDVLMTPLSRLYEDLSRQVLADIARHLSKSALSSAAWQANRIQESGALYQEVVRRVALLTHQSEAEVRAMLERGGAKAIAGDAAMYRAVGAAKVAGAVQQLSPAAAQVLQAMVARTQGTLENITRSTANAAQQAFLKSADRAFMLTSSGSMSYDQAMRTVIKEAAAQGVSTISYATGHVDQLDVAVRRALLTSVSQTAATLQLRLAKLMNNDLVQTSAHIGARPEHAEWQGKVFSLSGDTPGYGDFELETGYGEVDGLCGINCRHSFYPFFPGLSVNPYDEQTLREYREAQVTYNGEAIPMYQATQMQRAMEREVRFMKRQAGMLAAANLDNAAELARIQELQAELRDFTRQTGLFREPMRELIVPTAPGFTQTFSGTVDMNTIMTDLPGATARMTERIRWDANKTGGIVLARGGAIPTSGPIVLTSDPQAAVTFSENGAKGLSTYYLDKRKLLVQGSAEWERVVGEDWRNVQGADWFDTPPKDFLSRLKAEGYGGYANEAGTLVRIENKGLVKFRLDKKFVIDSNIPPGTTPPPVIKPTPVIRPLPQPKPPVVIDTVPPDKVVSTIKAVEPAQPTVGNRVSAHMRVTTAKVGDGSRAAYRAIDRVHSDGDLPYMDVRQSTRAEGSVFGYYRPGYGSSITILPKARKSLTQAMETTIHETGHALDNWALEDPAYKGRLMQDPHLKYTSANSYASDRAFRTQGGGPLGQWYKAVTESKPYQSLKAMADGDVRYVEGFTEWGRTTTYAVDKKFTIYLTEPTELIARSYTQYIATKTGNLEMLKLLEERNRVYPQFWTEEEFKPIMDAYDELFRSRGWLK